jgi:RES domain-containing protein
VEPEVRELSGTWFRCVSIKRDPLSFAGSQAAGGRFNDVGAGALYLAGTPAVAVAEHLQLGGLYGVTSFPPRMLVTIEVTLSRVVDLTDARVRDRYGIGASELMSAWRDDRSSPTQALGRRLQAIGTEAVMFPSSIATGAANLAVFTENLLPTSRIAVVGLDSG